MTLRISDWLLNPHQCPGYVGYHVIDHVEKLPMIHHTEHHVVNLAKRYALVNITNLADAALDRSGIKDGFCFVSAMHITAGVYINDAESGLLSDIAKWIENLAPYGLDYQHHQTGEDNGDAHLKSYLTNPSLQVPITQGKLDLGTWQQIFYAEFDGKRNKRIMLKICGI